jgi:hypothetical protein
MILLFILILIIILSLILIECSAWSIGKYGGNTKIKYGGGRGECNKCKYTTDISKNCQQYIDDEGKCKTCGHSNTDHRDIAMDIEGIEGAASRRFEISAPKEKEEQVIGDVNLFSFNNPGPSSTPSSTLPLRPLQSATAEVSAISASETPEPVSPTASVLSTASAFSASPTKLATIPASAFSALESISALPSEIDNVKLIKAIHHMIVVKQFLIEQIDKVIRFRKPLFHSIGDLQEVFKDSKFRYMDEQIENNMINYTNLDTISNDDLKNHIINNNNKLKKIL